MSQDEGLYRATGARPAKAPALQDPAHVSQAEALRLSEIEMNRQLLQPRLAPPFYLPPPEPTAADRARQAEALRRAEEEMNLDLFRRAFGAQPV